MNTILNMKHTSCLVVTDTGSCWEWPRTSSAVFYSLSKNFIFFQYCDSSRNCCDRSCCPSSSIASLPRRNPLNAANRLDRSEHRSMWALCWGT